jgi:PTS system nitrogen regulatory IIA component
MTGENAPSNDRLLINQVITQISVNNKRSLFQTIAQNIASHTRSNALGIYDRLVEKEELETSGIGNGIAIPHARRVELAKPHAILTVLKNPIEFDSADRKYVDIVYTILSPRADGPLHLQRLSAASRFFKDKEICARIRETHDPDLLYTLLQSEDGWMIAA